MKKTVLFFVQIAFLAGVLFSLNFQAAAQISLYLKAGRATATVSDSYNSSLNAENSEKQVFDLINRERQKQGLSYLEWNGNLARLARDYSQKMANENFFSHYDNRGASIAERARDARIKSWRKIGENLFESIGDRNYTSSSVVMWMKSPGHRRNILDSQWTQTGIGIARARDGKIYITQVFIEN